MYFVLALLCFHLWHVLWCHHFLTFTLEHTWSSIIQLWEWNIKYPPSQAHTQASMPTTQALIIENHSWEFDGWDSNYFGPKTNWPRSWLIVSMHCSWSETYFDFRHDRIVIRLQAVCRFTSHFMLWKMVLEELHNLALCSDLYLRIVTYMDNMSCLWNSCWLSMSITNTLGFRHIDP